jgi:pimeloyl-ACP methyl ester carboxylesterase
VGRPRRQRCRPQPGEGRLPGPGEPGRVCGREDWSASFLPWGFGPAAVQAPVALWHGLRDTAAPPAHSRWLAAHIPHATAHFPADEDHTNIEENNRSAAIAWVRDHM